MILLTPAISRTYLAEDERLSKHPKEVVAQHRRSAELVQSASLPSVEEVFASRMLLCWPGVMADTFLLISPLLMTSLRSLWKPETAGQVSSRS